MRTVITKTPVRLSYLGGGTDYPNWAKEYGGVILGAALAHYSWIHLKSLPPFHKYHYRVSYSEIEQVDKWAELKHAPTRVILSSHNCPPWGKEIAHMCDVPKASGLGTSSSYIVGLLNALLCWQGQYRCPEELFEEATKVQEELGETVGLQDQLFAAFGGFNIVRFHKSLNFSVEPVSISEKEQQSLADHTLLLFTGQHRVSSEIAQSYVPHLTEACSTSKMLALMKYTEDGISSVYEGNWQKLGELIEKSWYIKSSLSPKVADPLIQTAYAQAKLGKAWGGKLTGAGGGGSLMLLADPTDHNRILKNVQQVLPDCVRIPVQFDQLGSRVAFAQ